MYRRVRGLPAAVPVPAAVPIGALVLPGSALAHERRTIDGGKN
jgi:hypothetical protein